MSTLNDNGLWTEIEQDFVSISNESDDKQIKEIKGLTDRLCYLSGFLDECKVCLATLKEVADVSLVYFVVFEGICSTHL
jgi:hypothetical protein